MTTADGSGRRLGVVDTASCRSASSAPSPPIWVESIGGPLIVVPVSALEEWAGSTGVRSAAGDAEVPDDYDRACAVDGLAGAIEIGGKGRQGLVLADEPATTSYLPQHRAFVRWLGADSAAALIKAAVTVLRDPAVEWHECGFWETDGPALLMDSVDAGSDLYVPYPEGGTPEQAPVPIAAARWRVRAVHTRVDERTSVGVVQLLP
ncbi:Imm21 family immunity protein [Plantactinospora sp. KLBMP9567]|uniref:Imm21 family immunity protein n=1 Tax=Plantactinospora sp. KLBMP9567 TaxID=3085900 RepID=UPI003990B520